MQGEVSAAIAQVATLLGSKDSAPTYFLFGAGNSGGTASPDGLALGLEVVCRDARTPAQAQQVIREYVAHEMTHVFQVRAGLDIKDHDLLQHTLSEGFADFVALDHAGIPVDLAAGQILPRIRKDGLPRTVCDYLSGMTDRYLMEEHERLFAEEKAPAHVAQKLDFGRKRRNE